MYELILLIVLFILSAFFSSAETAMTSISRMRVAHLVELKKPGARILHRLRERPAALLTTILVGNNLVNISASVLATTMVTDFFYRIGWKEDGLVIGILIGLLTFFILVFGEVVPKTVAIRNAEPWALWISPIMLVLQWGLSPVAWLLTGISRPFVFLLGGRIPEGGPFITEEEIKSLLYVGEKEGVIEREEREMISGIFKFGDLTVTQVMTERDKIDFVEVGEKVSGAIEKIKKSGHSRLPVIDQNLDNVIGVLYAKDLLTAAGSEEVSRHLRQVPFIPGVKKVSDLLEQMQAEYKHLAIVVDEFGHTLGLVTLEDLLEEIVGEIHDEYEKRK